MVKKSSVESIHLDEASLMRIAVDYYFELQGQIGIDRLIRRRRRYILS